MPQLLSYRKLQVPRDIALQIASYVRFQWPAYIGHGTPLWESMPYPDDALHFVVMDADVLISHAMVSARMLSHAGQSFNVYGLSSVFCYPTHRGGGFGAQVVSAASDYIRGQDDADLALLFCGERVQTLYRRVGWEQVERVQVHFGDVNQPQTYEDGLLMGLFVSRRAMDARTLLEGQPLYVGSHTW